MSFREGATWVKRARRVPLTAAQELLPLTDWSPTRVIRTDGETCAVLVRTDAPDADAPFLDLSLDRSTPAVCAPLSAVMRYTLEPRLPAAFLFHMGRCGSSLAASLLRATGAVSVLGEPVAVNDLFFRREADPAADARLEERAKFIVNWLVASHAGSQPCVIKVSSWLALHLDRFRTWFPSVPCYFLSREPVEVVSAIVDTPPFMYRRARMRRQFAQPPPGDPFYADRVRNAVRHLVDYEADRDFAEFVARFVGTICETAARTRAASPGVVPIDYATLQAQILDGMLGRLGVQTTASVRTRVQDAMRFDAKSFRPGIPFESDATRKTRRATPQMVALCHEHIEPALQRLRADPDAG